MEILLVPIVIAILAMVRQINQYERWVVFTMWKFTTIYDPWWKIIIPIFQRLEKIDIRVKAVDVPDQESITKDNIPVRLNAVIYYKISDASKVILEVENYYYATSQLAQTVMRNAVWEYTLDQLLQDRVSVAKLIKDTIDKSTDAWWIDVQSVELKDIVLPDSLKRTIAKAAEAEREKKSVIIASEWEVIAAENMAKAAETLSRSPWALHLRTLQSINDLSSDDSNTTVWMVPIEALKALDSIANSLKNK